MKTPRPMPITTRRRTTLASLLGVSLLALCAAAAQTSVYYTSGSGGTPPPGATLGGTLADVGLDMYQSVAPTDTGVISAYDDGLGSLIFSNFTVGSLPSVSPTDGGALTSITFTIFIDNLTHPDVSLWPSATTWNIFGGLDGTGSVVGTFNASHPANSQGFISFDVSPSVLAGGFSVGASWENQLLNMATESNLTAFNTPIVTANYAAIPEPSAALLGTLASLGFLRRRRA